MPPRPAACAARCAGWERHAATAASSRQNDSDSSLPGVARLSNRSTEMKPSIVASSSASRAAIPKIGVASAGRRLDLEDHRDHGVTSGA